MLQIDSVETGPQKILKILGRIDGLSAPDVEKEFESHISAGSRVLLIDFTAVSYLSSAGLRVFMSTQKKLKKIGGEVIILFPSAQILEVFRVSGFVSVFQIFTEKDVLDKYLQSGSPAVAGKLEMNGIPYTLLSLKAAPGEFFTIGSQSKLNPSDYKEEDVIKVAPDKIRFGTGLAALGDCFDEYKGLLGETVIIGKNFFSYPALKKSSVDFMLNSQSHPGAYYNFLHGFGFNGSYSSVIKFEKEDGFLSLLDILPLFERNAATNIFGVVILSESAGLFGMNLKKIPIAENKPSSGNIFDQNNFGDWIDFPLEGANYNSIIAATGVVVKDKSKLNDEINSVFSSESNFHIHSAIFEKGSLNRNIQEFDSELTRVLTELEAIKVQHILGKTKFKTVIAAIIELETE